MARIRKHDIAHNKSIMAYMQMVRNSHQFGNFKPFDIVEFESRDWYVYDADAEATAPDGFTLVLYRQGEFADGVLITEVKPSPSRDELRAKIQSFKDAAEALANTIQEKKHKIQLQKHHAKEVEMSDFAINKIDKEIQAMQELEDKIRALGN